MNRMDNSLGPLGMDWNFAQGIFFYYEKKKAEKLVQIAGC